MNASETIVKMHGALVSNLALWFAMLSPLIGPIVAFLSARLFGHVVG
jgi:hypothetical protein